MTIKCDACEKVLSNKEGYLIMELYKSTSEHVQTHYCYACYQDMSIDNRVRQLLERQKSEGC